MAAFGDTLRQARAHKGISLIEAAQATYINRYYLVALEEENFSVLPDGATFRRGIVRHYSSYLGLDPTVLIRLYEESSGDRPVAAPIGNTPAPNVHGGLGYLNFSMIGVVAVLMLVGFAWFYSAYFGTSPSNDTPTQIIATLTPYDQSELNIPTMTPIPPSPTATVQPSPTSEALPSPTPTEEVAQTDQTIADTAADTGEPIDTPTDEPVISSGESSSDTSDSSVAASIQVLAQGGDIYVTVTVDGSVVFDDTLADGGSTPFFNGAEVVVSTSEGSLTWFNSANSDDFSMGGDGEQTYIFP